MYMTKFNETAKGVKKISNYEGAPAYKQNADVELYSAVVTSILSDSFYEKENERLERIQKLIKVVDPKFVARLAIYARNEMNLRSLPLVLVVELAKIHNGDDLIRKMVNKVVIRVDELTELLSYYARANGRTDTKKLGKLSNQLKAGLADRFNAFDEYQFGKYDRKTAISLRDVLFLVHPKATADENQALFDKIVNASLATPYTWETELSAVGQVKYDNEEEKKKAVTKVWEELIDSKKVGYMAMLRNLRNILEAGVSGEHFVKLAEYLSNEKAVLGSRQFPFRFLSAYRELKDVRSSYTPMILDALEEAVLHTAKSIKGYGYETNVAIACDVSGSMQHQISPKSTVQNYDIGLMLGMLLQNNCKRVITGMFGDEWKVINVPKNNILSNVMEYHSREGEVGYSTNGHLVLDDLTSRKEIVDKVMMFTDCQMWDSRGRGSSMSHSWGEYKKVAPNAKLYLFDLSGYGHTPVSIEGGDVFLIAGWSDKVFDMLDAYENGSSAIEKIKSIEL